MPSVMQFFGVFAALSVFTFTEAHQFVGELFTVGNLESMDVPDPPPPARQAAPQELEQLMRTVKNDDRRNECVHCSQGQPGR